jgi:mevalonate kinase
MNNTLDFRSNGKLMITGEYLVLAGAKALAMPVRYGQRLSVTSLPAQHIVINWRSYVQEKLLIEASFSGTQLNYKTDKTSSGQHKNRLRQILLAAKTLNPDFLSKNSEWNVRSDIEFDLQWGLGSSSTLISNIAAWAGVNPYELHFKVSEGSAYDIACARSNHALLYTFRGRQKEPEIQHVSFNPDFSSQLFFIYSGKKQSSDESIRSFHKEHASSSDVDAISALSMQMAATTNLLDFIKMMDEHERITSKYTTSEAVKKSFFPDFQGSVKSLGAWGGDFLLAASTVAPKKIITYFRNKGLSTIISFNDMSLASHKSHEI